MLASRDFESCFEPFVLEIADQKHDTPPTGGTIQVFESSTYIGATSHRLAVEHFADQSQHVARALAGLNGLDGGRKSNVAGKCMQGGHGVLLSVSYGGLAYKVWGALFLMTGQL